MLEISLQLISTYLYKLEGKTTCQPMWICKEQNKTKNVEKVEKDVEKDR